MTEDDTFRVLSRPNGAELDNLILAEKIRRRNGKRHGPWRWTLLLEFVELHGWPAREYVYQHYIPRLKPNSRIWTDEQLEQFVNDHERKRHVSSLEEAPFSRDAENCRHVPI